MPEQVKNILNKLLEFWNKWSTKQKTIIISVFAGLIVAISLLVFILGRTRYTDLYTFESTESASLAVQSLKNNSISARLSSDGRTVQVDKNMYVESVTTVYSSDIGGEEFPIDKLLDTSLTTTNGERLLRNFLRSESKVKAGILQMTGVEAVTLNYIPKDTSNSIIASNQAVPVGVQLVTNSKFDKKTAQGIAEVVAAAFSNNNTEKVTIIDQDGVVLFDGDAVETDEIDTTDKIALEKEIKKGFTDIVDSSLVMNGYVENAIAVNLVLDFNKVTQMYEEYIPLDGEEYGVLYERHRETSESSGGASDVPGTDSNDDATSYYIAGTSSGNSESSKEDLYYKPSYRITNTVYDTGTIKEASIAITARKPIERTKSQLETLGLLEGTTFEEYILNQPELVLTRTPDDLYDLVSMATGIDEDKIVIITYEVYRFIDDTAVSQVDITLIVQIAMAVLLLGILLFVLLRGMKPVEITEVEPELSIEQLLATTKENQGLEDVEFNEESETRKMIEKFFDENPEAVANLLRNWLNEDWM